MMWRLFFAIFPGIQMNQLIKSIGERLAATADSAESVLHVIPLHENRLRAYESVGEVEDGCAGEESRHMDCLQRAADVYVRSNGATGKRPPAGFVRAAKQQHAVKKETRAKGCKTRKRETHVAESSADTGCTSVLDSVEEDSFGSYRHHGSACVTAEVCKNDAWSVSTLKA
jgi:hypothetical protein